MSEYPWSSDEENNVLQATIVPRSARRAGTTETAGTSGQAAATRSIQASPPPSRLRSIMQPHDLFSCTIRSRAPVNTETSLSYRNNMSPFLSFGTSLNPSTVALAHNAIGRIRGDPTSSRTSEHIPYHRRAASVIRSSRLNRPMHTTNSSGHPTSSRTLRIPFPTCRNTASPGRRTRLNRPMDNINFLEIINSPAASSPVVAIGGAAGAAWRAQPSSPQISGVARSSGETSVVVAAENITPARRENNVEQENAEDIGGTTTAALEVSLEEILEIECEPEVNNVSEESVVQDVGVQSNPENIENESPIAVTEESQRHGIKRKIDGSSDDCAMDLNQKLLRLLECLVCLEWLEPPMAQCRRGHLVCTTCRVRLAACPVCRTAFSSVRNRAMESVAEIVRYPCRHGCGCMVRMRRRISHEASCTARCYRCVAPGCDAALAPLDQLITHVKTTHTQIVKVGNSHMFRLLMNDDFEEDWLVLAMDQLFHLRIKVDVRSWCLIIYVTYIGPKCKACKYKYEVKIKGEYRSRCLVYSRATHSDLETSSLNISRQDCFHLSLDQVHNYLRFKNKHCETDKMLEFKVAIHGMENEDIPIDVN